MFDSLRPHELQHARPPCPSPTPGVYSNSCLSSQWYHPAISSSVVPSSSCPQSLPVSGSFPMSQLFAWGGQSTGGFSFSISPSNEHQGLISFRMDWLYLLAVQGTLKSLLQHHSSKYIKKSQLWLITSFAFFNQYRRLYFSVMAIKTFNITHALLTMWFWHSYYWQLVSVTTPSIPWNW